MPLIATVMGAILTGLFYWLIWGHGLEYLESHIRQSRERKRDAERRAAALDSQCMAPLRSISDARDAAAVLMFLVARQRGVPTPEQTAAIEHDMREVLGLGRELAHRIAFADFAAEQVHAADQAVDELTLLLCKSLNQAERRDLFAMLRRVAAVHGGPINLQARLIERLEQRLRETP